MELIIGRDGPTSRLKVVEGPQVKYIGEPASVHDDVSRQHCQLTFVDDNTFIIKNIKAANVTWVNGVEVQSARIKVIDTVQLGPSRRYTLPLKEIIEQFKPNVTDISPLKKVWEDYNNSLIAIRKRQQRNGLLSSIPMGFTMLGGLISGLAPENLRTSAYVFTGLAFLIMVYGLYRRFTDKSIEQQEALKKQFQHDYVCPKCGRFLGYQDFDIIRQHSNCLFCRAQYKF